MDTGNSLGWAEDNSLGAVVLPAWRIAGGMDAVVVDVAPSESLAAGGHSTSPTSWSGGNADRIEMVEAWDGAQASTETPRLSPHSPLVNEGRAEAANEEALGNGCVPSMCGESSPTVRCGECRFCQTNVFARFDRFCLRLFLLRPDMGGECGRNHGQGFRRGERMSRSGSRLRERQKELANLGGPLSARRRRLVGHGRQMRPRRNGTREIQRV